MRKQGAMKRAALALVLVVGTAFALASGPAEATTATTYDIASATATPRFLCTEFGCPCRMKSGTGTLEASWPDDPTLPAAQGTFTFNAHDSHAVVLAGSITSSSLSVLLPGAAIGGSVTYPPSPCTGGTAQAEISFGG